MTSPYFIRLLLLSGASFFLIQIALGIIVSLLAPAAIRYAERITPRRAACFLLALRLTPVGIGAFAVFALCIPSYLLFEPRSGEEEIGWMCIAVGLGGCILAAIGLYRALNQVGRSSFLLSRLAKSAVPTQKGRFPICIVESATPCLALAGVLRPKLLISRIVLSGLSEDQFSVALRHEEAHRDSLDNLKRLLILLAPPMFPGCRALEHAWARFAEWAADDRAAAGDPHRSVSLAEALVCVARMGAPARLSPIVTSLLQSNDDLSARVDRLLNCPCPAETSEHFIARSFFLLAMALIAWMLAPSSLAWAHRILEHLID